MPSLYLEHDGRLRCVAQRGLWQVLDGLSGEAGITGRTWATGSPITLPDVAASADYLEAIPGVVAEICVPIVVDGHAVGSLNVESLHPFPADTAAVMRTYAQLLAGQLAVVGYRREVSAWQRSARASAAIAELGTDDDALVDALARHMRRGPARLRVPLAQRRAYAGRAGRVRTRRRSIRSPPCDRAHVAVERRRPRLVVLHRGRGHGARIRRNRIPAQRRCTRGDPAPAAGQGRPGGNDRAGEHAPDPDHRRRCRAAGALGRPTRGDAGRNDVIVRNKGANRRRLMPRAPATTRASGARLQGLGYRGSATEARA